VTLLPSNIDDARGDRSLASRRVESPRTCTVGPRRQPKSRLIIKQLTHGAELMARLSECSEDFGQSVEGPILSLVKEHDRARFEPFFEGSNDIVGSLRAPVARVVRPEHETKTGERAGDRRSERYRAMRGPDERAPLATVGE
jgi:hypothetical protein